MSATSNNIDHALAATAAPRTMNTTAPVATAAPAAATTTTPSSATTTSSATTGPSAAATPIASSSVARSKLDNERTKRLGEQKGLEMATAAAAAENPPSSSSSTGGAPITTLVHPKTMTITFVPDWTQAEMQSPKRPVTVSVVLGPSGTLPQHSQWCFEFLLFCEETSSAASTTSSASPGGKAFAIPKGERALLWHVNAPYPRFEHAVARSGCRVSTGDELKTVSVALRTHGDEKHPNALVYVRRNKKIPKSDSNTGYLKVVRRHHYYFNITFAAGSTIAQLIGLYAWRPMIYLTSKKVDPTTGRDTVTGSRVFTHFNTYWLQGVEHNPSEAEQKAAAEATAADKKEEELLKLQPLSPNSATGSTSNALFSPTPSVSIVPVHPLTLPLPARPSFVGTSPISPFPPAPPVLIPPGKLASKMAIAQSMTAGLPDFVTPSQAQQFHHAVQRAQHQQQQAQLLEQYQSQYRNQQRALEQYEKLQAHTNSLPCTQEQEKRLKVEAVVQPTLTLQQIAFLPQHQATAIASSQVIASEKPKTTNESARVAAAPVKDYAELETAIRTKTLDSVDLPALDEVKSKAETETKAKADILFPGSNEISFEPVVSEFNQRSVVSKALAIVEFAARVVKWDSKHEAFAAARHMLDCITRVNELVGYQHVSWYIKDKDEYLKKSKDEQSHLSLPAAFLKDDIKANSMDDYQKRGQALIKRLAQRIEWLLGWQRTAKKPFNAEFALKVIAADRVWAHDAKVFIKEQESKVTEMLVSNQTLFQEFREQQRKGVGWPHSVELRKTIEGAGFVYRPMMVKRDKCVCETCGVEVSGWRPWHNPWSFHNFSRHDVTFRPPQPWLDALDPKKVSDAITEANVSGNQTAAAGTTAASGTSVAAPAVASVAPIASSSAASTSTTTASQKPMGAYVASRKASINIRVASAGAGLLSKQTLKK